MGTNEPSVFGKGDAHTILLHNGPAIMWEKNAHLHPSGGEGKGTDNLHHNLNFGQFLHRPDFQGCMKLLRLNESQTSQSYAP